VPAAIRIVSRRIRARYSATSSGLHRMRRRSVTAAMTTLALVPLVAALVGVVAVSGFMYTPQLAGTLAVVVVVAAVTVPVAALPSWLPDVPGS
jgi:hypothetical protein